MVHLNYAHPGYDEGFKAAYKPAQESSVLYTDANTYGVPTPAFEIDERPLDDIGRVKAIIIGAGIAGISAGILLPRKVPNLDLTIYEKNAGLSGTWFENVYPGIRCDVPAHAYQSTFEPNPKWSAFYAPGDEINQYWNDVAEKYGVDKLTKTSHKVTKAEWDSETKEWVVGVLNLKTGETIQDRANFIITAYGHFNNWQIPDFPGLKDFEGHLRHSSAWDPEFNATGKRVALIGNGASGIQILPQLQKTASHVDHYARNPTWIAKTFGGEDPPNPPTYATLPEQQKAFEDPEEYLKFRKSVEKKTFTGWTVTLRGSDLNNKLNDEFNKIYKERLGDKYEEYIDLLRPDYSPVCRRITPGVNYIESLIKDNVDYIKSPIKRILPNAIETEDGTIRPVDAIIAATGSDTTFAPPFPIIARGVDLAKAWRPSKDGAPVSSSNPGFPDTYLGISAPNFPNLFFLYGPNSLGWGGTLPYAFETEATYIAQVLRKSVLEGISSVTPTLEAVDDFRAFQDAYFPRTVFTENCSSWYNAGKRLGGRIPGIWPGSFLHNLKLRRDPRWEDFKYEYKNKWNNRFGFLGNGGTKLEIEGRLDEIVDRYLKPKEQINLRTIHEDWADIYDIDSLLIRD